MSQLVLVFRTLEDRWPIGDIVFGTAFFTIAQIILFAFSVTICDAIKHYIDGLFFFTLCMLLSVMMVYKYWDSITVRMLRSFYPCHISHICSNFSGRISNSPLAPRHPSGRSRILYSLARPTTSKTLPVVTTVLEVLSEVSAAVSYMAANVDIHRQANNTEHTGVMDLRR